MKRMVLSLLALYSGSAIALAQAVQIQPPPISPGAALPTPRGGTPAPPEGKKEETFNISFPGGRSTEFVQVLQGAMKDVPPVIIPGNATDVSLPEFELRNVTLTEVFNALNLLGSRENWFWQAAPRASNDSGSPIWVLTRNTNRGRTDYGMPMRFGQAEPQIPEMRVQPIYVGYLLEKYKIEDLTTAIETGWKMAGAPNTGDTLPVDPEMKYHKDTQLLILKGYPTQLSFVNELLQQLAAPIKKAAPATEPGKPATAETKK